MALASNGETVGTLVTRLGLLSEDDTRRAIGNVMALSPMPDLNEGWEKQLTADGQQGPPFLDANYCRTAGIIPLTIGPESLVAAMLDPSDFVVRESVGFFC